MRGKESNEKIDLGGIEGNCYNEEMNIGNI